MLLMGDGDDDDEDEDDVDAFPQHHGLKRLEKCCYSTM